MADKFKDEGSKARRGDDDARDDLEKNWARTTASMISPGSARGSPVRKRRAGGGPAPLPVSALPVPDEEPDSAEQPASLTLSTNERGELTPAQRARLGLDLEPANDGPAAQSAANAPEAPPAEPPPGGTFDFRAIGTESGDAEAPSSQRQAGAEPVRLRPVDNGPRLKPVSDSGPRLAPVRQPSAVSAQQRSPAAGRDGPDDEFEHVKRDRNVLSYGVAWSAFVIVITGTIAFTNSLSGDPAASVGPGPLIPGLLSIAIGWVIVIAARGMGNGWWGLMLVPAVVLLVGPYVYQNYWAGNVERAARSYLSNRGVGVLIDFDATSVVSETVNTDRGCFSINRTRSNNDTVVGVTTYQYETTRQQADFALAPRYAGRTEAGGERSLYRIFTFKGGRAPAIVSTPTSAPLDCKNSTSPPGTGAKRDTGS